MNRKIILLLLWFLVASVFVGVFVAGLGPRYRELAQACRGPACPALALDPGEIEALETGGLSIHFYAAYHVAFEVVVALLMVGLAGLVLWRKPGEWLGLLVSLALVMSGTVFYPNSNSALARVYPHLVPLTNLLFSLGGAAYILFIFLFPNGRFSPRWMRYLALALIPWIVVVVSLQMSSYWQDALTGTNDFTNYSLLAWFIAGLLAQIYRYTRDSDAVQRQQTRWVLSGLLGTLGGGLIWMVLGEQGLLLPGQARLWLSFPGMAAAWGLAAMLPLAIVFSILRYRLWDIDLLIRRTLIYGLLTAVLALAYLGSVLGLQGILVRLTGEARSELTTVVSTLLIAALFTPLRRRIQQIIDQRFYRKRYDAERTLQVFAATLRNEVDLNQLSSHLQAVVMETMQPESISLWLRESRGASASGARSANDAKNANGSGDKG